MFTEKKFRSLNAELRYRKAIKILKDAENNLKEGQPPNIDYLNMILKIVFEDEPCFEPWGQPPVNILYQMNSLKYRIIKKAGIQVADWDMYTEKDDFSKQRKVLPISVYLEDIRSPFNVGSIFRTAESFCFSKILLSEETPTPEHNRAKRSAMGTDAVLDWQICKKEELRDSPLFVLETGGTSIEKFHFPKTGIMVLGSEETGVSPELLEIAKSSLGIVSIPIFGVKKSINVGVAFGIAAYCWTNSILAE